MGKRKSSEEFTSGKPSPARWPLLMSRETAAEYLSLSADTFDRICPVMPVDLPFTGVRWSRADLEEWILSLARKPRRAKRAPPIVAPLDIPPPRMSPEDRRAAALKKAEGRAR